MVLCVVAKPHYRTKYDAIASVDVPADAEV